MGHMMVFDSIQERFAAQVAQTPDAVAVSSGGESPHFAQRVRDEIGGLLPEDLDAVVKDIGNRRRRILREYAPGEERARLLRDLVYPRGARA